MRDLGLRGTHLRAENYIIVPAEAPHERLNLLRRDFNPDVG